MNDDEKRRLEAEGWEFMGHTPNNPWADVAEHMAALRGGDTGFLFMLHGPLPSEEVASPLYSVWKRRNETIDND
jgi:hypothetical protein